ncbi:hypothetical protein MA16_Dca024296 [Dendrobium catenatum]|uniref:Uncharacterized protein n=1 Tax=Dendrobium catenatum TaxID=906689 RepID=A0A2I0VCA2_9ASPA|nr:hypothetical protein MA16_Dca024296 [Dendrobium catenatum]
MENRRILPSDAWKNYRKNLALPVLDSSEVLTVVLRFLKDLIRILKVMGKVIEEQFEASDDILTPDVVLNINCLGNLPAVDALVEKETKQGINSDVNPDVEILNKFDVLSELIEVNEAEELDSNNEIVVEEGEILESITESDLNVSDKGLVQQPEVSRNENLDMPVINPYVGGNQASEKKSKHFKELRSLGSGNVIPHNRKRMVDLTPTISGDRNAPPRKGLSPTMSVNAFPEKMTGISNSTQVIREPDLEKMPVLSPIMGKGKQTMVEEEERESKGERERGSYEGEFVRGFIKVSPSKDPSSSSPIIILSSLGILERSTSASDQGSGSLPTLGERERMKGSPPTLEECERTKGSLPILGEFEWKKVLFLTWRV